MKHHTRDILKINESLKKTQKLIIALGCSYTHGKSAYSQALLDYKAPIYKDNTYGYHHYDIETKKDIANRFPRLELFDEYLCPEDMELDNAYVNVLCSKYLNNEYTAVNFGIEGCGNYATISRLFLYPIDYSLAKEIIVIYMPSGMSRFDIVSDSHEGHLEISWLDFNTIWPQSEDSLMHDPVMIKNLGRHDTPWNLVQTNFTKAVMSEKFNVKKSIIDFNILQNWVKLYSAKLIIFSAFEHVYNKIDFKRILETKITRNDKTKEFINEEHNKSTEFAEVIDYYINSIPWDNFFNPQNAKSFHEFSLLQEVAIDKNFDMNLPMQQLVDKRIGSPNLWVMPCGHPSAKAHDLLAKELLGVIK